MNPKHLPLVFVWCSPVDVPGKQFIPTGQGNITSLFLESKVAQFKIFTPKISTIIPTIISLYYSIITSKNPIVYIISSRTILGFIRDFPALVTVFCGQKVCSHIHGSDLYELFKKPVIGKVSKLLYNNIDRLIAPTQFALVNHPNVKSLTIQKSTIFNPVLIDEKRLNIPKSLNKSKPPTIIWNSNLISSKGLFETLEALVYISKNKEIDFSFILLGRPYSDSEKSVNELLNKLVHYLDYSWLRYIGPTSSSKAIDYLIQSDIVVLPSRYKSECQPLALTYAMKLGKVIVTSDHLSIKETLGRYPAFIVKDTYSVSQVADQVVRALAFLSTNKTISEDIIDEVSTRFSLKKFITEMRYLLLELESE